MDNNNGARPGVSIDAEVCEQAISAWKEVMMASFQAEMKAVKLVCASIDRSFDRVLEMVKFSS